MTPEDLLADFSPEVVETVQALRGLFRDAVPEATERAYPGWRGIGYRHPIAGLLGTIFPLADRVTLYFEHGRFLPDPQQVLSGDGTQSRQISISSLTDIPTAALRQLILEATAYGQARRSKATPRQGPGFSPGSPGQIYQAPAPDGAQATL